MKRDLAWASRSPDGVERAFVAGAKGRIETISLAPEFPGAQPTLYFLVGWWGSAADYIPTMRYFAGLGFACRSFSWRGAGQSGGNSFWGLGYEEDLLRVIRHFKDDRLAFIAHSGAADYVRQALPQLQTAARGAVETLIFIAPLARSGAMQALLGWLRPDGSGTSLTRWLRFLGSNIFGLAWFMRNELALRRVLLSDSVSDDVVAGVWRQIDRCPYGRYFLSLWRFPEFLQPRRARVSDFGVPRAIVLHCELDANFSEAQQRQTAEGFGAEFVILPNACHQWFADPHSFQQATEQILLWLNQPALAEPPLPLPLAV